MRPIVIDTEHIRLCDAMKLCGAVPTGGQAKLAVAAGEVTVNGEVCLQRGKKLRPGDVFAHAGHEWRIESASSEDEDRP